MWSGFKSEIEVTFCDVDRELELCHCFAGLCWKANVAAYTKDFCYIALELGN